jgi:hypothetical protein
MTADDVRRLNELFYVWKLTRHGPATVRDWVEEGLEGDPEQFDDINPGRDVARTAALIEARFERPMNLRTLVLLRTGAWCASGGPFEERLLVSTFGGRLTLRKICEKIDSFYHEPEDYFLHELKLLAGRQRGVQVLEIQMSSW